jgi:SecY interacting protein Syd
LIEQILTNLIQAALKDLENPVFKTDLDDWLSPCEALRDAQYSYWYPSLQCPKMRFDGFETAIEQPVHTDLKAFYLSFWSGALPCLFDALPISLIQVWNPDDFDRLIGNFIGHYLVQKNARQDLTLFIATVEDGGDNIISLDNGTGEVLLETPGTPDRTIVAPSLNQFLNRLRLEPERLNPIEMPRHD